jgi:hypothetical protein
MVFALLAALTSTLPIVSLASLEPQDRTVVENGSMGTAVSEPSDGRTYLIESEECRTVRSVAETASFYANKFEIKVLDQQTGRIRSTRPADFIKKGPMFDASLWPRSGAWHAESITSYTRSYKDTRRVSALVQMSHRSNDLSIWHLRMVAPNQDISIDIEPSRKGTDCFLEIASIKAQKPV